MTTRTPDIHPELGDEAFLEYLFTSLLGRKLDRDSLRLYRSHLRLGQTRAQIAFAIADSEEAARYGESAASARPIRTVLDLLALDGMPFLRHAYQQLLGREPDPTGVRDYAPRIVAGEAREQILSELSAGEEGKAYEVKLPGLAELVQTVRELNGESDTPATPASIDFLLQFDTDQFVHMAYRAILRRTADADGLFRYRGRIFEGYSKMFVLQALYSSSEAREKQVHIASLERRLNAYRRAQRPDWGGWFWRNVRGAESDLPRDRETRALLERLRQR